MPKFTYRARTADGRQVAGGIEVESVGAARAALARHDLHDVEISERVSLLQTQIFKRKRVAREDVMHFSRQLAAFVRAGVPILEAIDIFTQETGNARLREILLDVGEQLRSGERFSSSVSRHREAFPPFYVDMLQAAELTGHLDAVLEQIAHYIDRDLEARRKIRSALAYPIVIAGLSLVTVVILSVFVLPRFERLFASLNAELPLPTRMLLGMSHFMGTWWWLVLGIIFGSMLALYRWTRTGRGRAWRDRMALRLPVAGEVVRYSIIERFCRIFSSMVQAGVPLPDALSVVGEGTNNTVYQRSLASVREEMLQGEGLSQPLGRTGLFPRSVIQMVRVGENTGTLETQLGLAATYFDQELEFKIRRITTLFEPAVILFMGFIVGFVAIALVSAMYGVLNRAGTVG